MTFEVREEAVGVGQNDSTAKYGIGEVRSGEVLEDDYGIAVIPEKFTDIVSGVDPSKFAGGTGRIGEEITKRGFGFGVAGQGVKGGTGGANVNDVSNPFGSLSVATRGWILLTPPCYIVVCHLVLYCISKG